VKAAARDLLATLKREKLVLDWKKKQQTRAAVLLAIRNVLDKDLPRAYDPTLYERKCDEVFEHVYEHYPTDVYAA
jgi:type I restriction enzyme R subunit